MPPKKEKTKFFTHTQNITKETIYECFIKDFENGMPFANLHFSSRNPTTGNGTTDIIVVTPNQLDQLLLAILQYKKTHAQKEIVRESVSLSKEEAIALQETV